ncbi:MAG: hypothetical protein JWM11_1318 [Planctomycetaceae bacterium]|nr:hypothetical protein [Planctomycetaceae bacterium]
MVIPRFREDSSKSGVVSVRVHAKTSYDQFRISTDWWDGKFAQVLPRFRSYTPAIKR